MKITQHQKQQAHIPSIHCKQKANRNIASQPNRFIFIEKPTTKQFMNIPKNPDNIYAAHWRANHTTSAFHGANERTNEQVLQLQFLSRHNTEIRFQLSQLKWSSASLLLLENGSHSNTTA